MLPILQVLVEVPNPVPIPVEVRVPKSYPVEVRVPVEVNTFQLFLL
jgi:hypothetical protein